jgi:hypothetical protein
VIEHRPCRKPTDGTVSAPIAAAAVQSETDPPLRLYALECPYDQHYYVFFVATPHVIDRFSGMLFANSSGTNNILAAGGAPTAQTPDTAFFDFIAWERLSEQRAGRSGLAWGKQGWPVYRRPSACLAIPAATQFARRVWAAKR